MCVFKIAESDMKTLNREITASLRGAEKGGNLFLLKFKQSIIFIASSSHMVDMAQ